MPDNQPAISAVPYQQGVVLQHGMTLRDAAALVALAGLLNDERTTGSAQDFARWSYVYADAMLAEREKQG